MKKLFLYAMLAASIANTSCNKQQPAYDVEMAVMIDATDSLTTYPTATELTAPLGLSTNPWIGCRIVCTYISDREINTTKIITLEKQNEWSGNTLLRQRQVQRFIEQLKDSLAAMKPNGSLHHSIVYSRIAQQCNQLARSTASIKYCLILSDLRENRTDMNFYDAQTINLLRSNPRIVEKRLTQLVALSSLANVQVWLLYNPPGYHENNSYMLIANFYRNFFDAHGAATHIANTFQPL